MRHFLIALIGIGLGGLSGLTFAQGAGPALDCGRGPATLSFGGVPWLAYACSDGRSVVLVSSPGSPAMPFYFMFSANASGHRLIGEGTGDKAVTDKAYKELHALSEAQIQRLFVRAVNALTKK